MKGSKSSPPKTILRFFKWFCDPTLHKYLEGDLLELFERNKEEKGSSKAKRLLVMDILKLFRPSIIKSASGTTKLNYYGMFKHNLKVSYRNLIRRKSYAFINIGGLVMGLSITLLIALWIADEFSFDRKNENFDRVARVMQKQTVNSEIHIVTSVPFPLSLELEEQYGEDFDHVVPSTWFGDYMLSNEETVITTRGGFMGESAPEVMSLKMIKGNRKGLSEESGILISVSTSKALFGDADPIGKLIKVHNEVSMKVTGVFEDILSNNSFHRVQFVGKWDFYVAETDWINKTAWNDNSFQLFVQLKENASIGVVAEKIERIKYDKTPEAERLYDTKVFLHPMKDWHLRSSWKNGEHEGGAIQYVWWFGIIGAFVLLLACVNFMNLSTAQSIRRAKEVGIRKAIGTARGQLVIQFLTESVLIVFISFLLASVVVYASLPFFNALTNKSIAMPLGDIKYWLLGFGFTFVVGLLSGSYPAIYLSSFNAIQVLKGTYQNALSAVLFRKFLVVFQFTIAISLIIGTMVISQQINYASERSLGYDESGTIMIEMTSLGHYSKSAVIKNELLASGLVTHFTQSSAPLTEVWNENDGFSWEGMDPNFNPMFCTFFVNHSYGATIDWEIEEGRDFSVAYSSDSSAMIINEAAAKYMQIDEPIGETVRWFKNFKLIGIVKNLLVESPFSEVRPAVYVINPGDNLNFTLLKLNPEIPTLSALSGIEEIFNSHIPKVPFKFDFVDDVHGKKFREVKRIASISQIFAVLAALISCLGLFGLASFMVEQRTKEMSIRKVLGAPFFTLWRLLSKEFILLVIVSCGIAIPLAYLGMSQWLENYDYRTPLHWWVFLSACLMTLLITVITISFRSIKVAKANPAAILKNE